MRSRARLGFTLTIALAISTLSSISAPAHATFPGSNGLIVWSKTFLLRDAELFTMNPDGSNQVQLTHNHQTDFDPAWTADGNHLAFTSCSGEDCDIWVMKADDSDEHDVSNDPG